MVLISIVGAVLPALAILLYFYRLDRLQPEPKGVILKVFVLGFLFAFLALGLEKLVISIDIPIPPGHLWRAAFHAFLVAGLIEESVKLFVVKTFVFDTVQFDEIADGVIYTVTASLGFACMENVLYVMEGGLSVAVARAISAVPLHAIASGLMGYYIGRAKFTTSGNRFFLLLFGLLLAVLIHGGYNFLIFALTPVDPLYAFLVFPYLFILFILLRNRFGFAVAGDVLGGRIMGQSKTV
ncbi:PrsW family intramembrane metalloprotease [candidate division KSB1 bacterium]|nr:PrsW family intramembrane metalloprotease [candidate division KSB1 bacterium]